MGKLLRVLVFVMLALSIGALVLGTLLFRKRELLVGRTHKLETAVKQLGLTIEKEAPPERPLPEDMPSRDISPCTSEILETPEVSDFWTSYPVHLEDQDLEKLDLKSRETELMSYYKLDRLTGKAQRDALGNLIVEGEGTMQGVLDDLLKKASEQYSRLNETRQYLLVLREEMMDTIDDLNSQKGELRVTLKKVDDLNADIDRLNGEISQLNDQVAALNEDKRALEDELADKERQMEEIEEEIQEKEATIAQLEKELESRPSGPARSGGPTLSPEGQLTRILPTGVVTPGDKGMVMAANQDWAFAVLNLELDFFKEILGDDLSKPLPSIDLYVRRPGDDGEFVAKVHVTQVRPSDNVAIVDVLPGWQQLPLEKGDRVFFGE